MIYHAHAAQQRGSCPPSPGKDHVSTATIFDIRRYSIHDGPGIRTAVFFKGCPLNCAWCHNPESHLSTPELMLRLNRCILCGDCLQVCPNDAIRQSGEVILVDRQKCTLSGECAVICPTEALQVVGREMTVPQVLAEIERDRVFFEQSGGGATFTGGEPLAQPLFLRELVEACRASGITTVVDTCGHAPWSVFKDILPLVDLFLYDLKLMDADRHLQWTGVSNENILANLRLLLDAGNQVRVRIPILPGINDDEGNLRACGEFLSVLPRLPAVELLPYHNIALGKYTGLGQAYRLPDLPSPSPEDMQRCAALLAEYGLR